MWYLLIFVILFVAEILYFRLANRFNIIDKPNLRSSHKSITLRGGGIVFTFGVLAFFLANKFPYAFFTLGLIAITTISFADDVKPQSKRLRIIVHTTAVGLLLYQLGFFSLPWYYAIIAFVMIIGIINAYNFMDGINGITTAYSFTVLAGLFFLNKELQVFDGNLILFLGIANLVFAYFNFRKKAKCFAGDVGSVSMAFCLLFITVGIVLQTGSFFFILLYAVYGVDSVLTILHRISKKENIFEAHRQHLFQYLANERKWPHLMVSTAYMLVQGAITFGVLLLWKKAVNVQIMYTLTVFIMLTIVYTYTKHKILKDAAHV